jgi:hypothetical protein
VRTDSQNYTVHACLENRGNAFSKEKSEKSKSLSVDDKLLNIFIINVGPNNE